MEQSGGARGHGSLAAASSWWSPESQPFTLPPSFFGGREKWRLEHSGMGGENLSPKDSLPIHWCIWGKGMARNWGHHPNIPGPPLIPPAGFPLPGTLRDLAPGCGQGEGDPKSPPSWGLPARSGLVFQEPFPPIFLVSWCLRRWGEHAGSVCGSEELGYLGTSGLGEIP